MEVEVAHRRGARAVPETLFEKIWDRHVVQATDEATLLYIDRHLVHEVTSPQAFDGLRLGGRAVRRPDLTFATVDHNVPTENQLDIREPMSRRQVEVLRQNCREFGITLYRRPERQPGHRPRHRARIGPDPARHDDRLRRQPHQHPRGVRGPGVRDRDVARSSTSWPRRPCGKGNAADVVRDRGPGGPGPGPGAEGHHPGDHPEDRHRRGDRAPSSSTTGRPSGPSRWKAA